MLTFAGLLIGAAVLALTTFAYAARRPDPPPWTTRTWIGEAVALAVVAGLAFGTATLVAGLVDAYWNGPSLVDLTLLAAALGVTSLLWRWLRARERLRSAQAGTFVRVAPVVPAPPAANAAIGFDLPLQSPPTNRAA